MNIEEKHSIRFLYFHFFQALGDLRSCSPGLRSTESRNESFWDGLGLEIDGAHPDFLGVPKSSPRAEGTFRRVPIDPFRGAMDPPFNRVVID